jgi:hypothetical protein
MVGRIAAGAFGAMFAMLISVAASDAHEPMFIEQGGAKMLS